MKVSAITETWVGKEKRERDGREEKGELEWIMPPFCIPNPAEEGGEAGETYG